MKKELDLETKAMQGVWKNQEVLEKEKDKDKDILTPEESCIVLKDTK